MNNYADPRWQRLRLAVMDRDGWQCVCCGDNSSTLNVHHKVYKGEIWESPLEDLQTLCKSCHAELGPHPRGGIWWSHRNDQSVGLLHVEHCPICRGTTFRDFDARDYRYMCLDCGHRLPFGERSWIAIDDNVACVPVRFGDGVTMAKSKPRQQSPYRGMTDAEIVAELERLVRQRRRSMGIKEQ